jgi:hypothetical protein
VISISIPQRRVDSFLDCYNRTHTLPATVAKLDDLVSPAEIKCMEAGSLSATTEPQAFNSLKTCMCYELPSGACLRVESADSIRSVL